MRAKFIYEVFIKDSDPIRDMGIGDKKTIIIEKIDKIAKKYGFKPHYNIQLNNFGVPMNIVIKTWYNSKLRGGTFVSLTYDSDNPEHFYIEVEDEYSESGGDPIEDINDIKLTDKWWKNL